MPAKGIDHYHLTATIELSAKDMYGKPITGSASVTVEKSLLIKSLSEFGAVLQYLENIPTTFAQEA